MRKNKTPPVSVTRGKGGPILSGRRTPTFGSTAVYMTRSGEESVSLGITKIKISKRHDDIRKKRKLGKKRTAYIG